MSNSIWKTPDQEQEHSEEVLIEYIGITGRPFYIFDEYVRRIPNQKRWCYITDLIAQADKAERLQKAVDLALGWLEKVATPAKCDDDLCREFTKRKIDEIKQLIKE